MVSDNEYLGEKGSVEPVIPDGGVKGYVPPPPPTIPFGYVIPNPPPENPSQGEQNSDES